MSETSRRELLRNIALGSHGRERYRWRRLSMCITWRPPDGVAERRLQAQGVHRARIRDAREDWRIGSCRPTSIRRAPRKRERRLSSICWRARIPELAAIYTGGIAWLDQAMERRYGHDFLSAQAGAAERHAGPDCVSKERDRRNSGPASGSSIGLAGWWWMRFIRARWA